MVLKQVIKELRSQPKIYYDANLKQPYFSQMLRKIEGGQCKPETVRKFLAKFGYTVKTEEQWQKKST